MAEPLRTWGYFGYVLPLKVSSGTTQTLSLGFKEKTTNISGPTSWNKFSVMIAKKSDTDGWEKGTELFSKDVMAAPNGMVTTMGHYAPFTFDIENSWLAAPGMAGSLVDVVVQFYAPGVNSDSSGTGLDYYSIPKTGALSLYYGYTDEDCFAVRYGTLTDARDNHTYKTLDIGGRTWMAENLNYQTANSWCGGGTGTIEGDCSKYGRLYSWEATKNACPDGWHLPIQQEWNDLIKAVGESPNSGKVLRSVSGWSDDGYATDEYGFTVLPAGGRSGTGEFSGLGDNAMFWTGTSSTDSVLIERLRESSSTVEEVIVARSYNSAFSVRCIQDTTTFVPAEPPSHKYDCNVYNCIPTYFLNQQMVAEGKYGELLDERDNSVYRTIKIGDQNWMAQDLYYDDQWAYSPLCAFYDGKSNCIMYVRRYNGRAIYYGVNYCPNGWHIPSTEEWYTVQDVDGSLRSNMGWAKDGGGDNSLGLSISGGFAENKYYWTADQYVSGYYYTVEFFYNMESMIRSNRDVDSGVSIRCVED